MKKTLFLCVSLFVANILFAQSDIIVIGANIVSRHFGQSFTQLVNSVPQGLETESRNNLLYVFNYPVNGFTSLFFVDPKKGVNHYVIFAHTPNDLKTFYENILRIISESYGNYVNSDSSVFFYSNLPENVSRIELSKPEADTENRNVLLIRWYGY